MWKILILAFLVVNTPLLAEVEWVKVKWDPGSCDKKCEMILKMKLKELDSVASSEVYPDAGSATVYWKPGESFDYGKLSIKLRVARIYPSEIRVQVRGTISKENGNYLINSTGDNSQFRLLQSSTVDVPKEVVKNGKIVTPNYFDPDTERPEETEYIKVESSNIQDHRLSPELRKELDDAEKTSRSANLEATLFLPYLFVKPPYVIIDHLSFSRR